MQHKPSKAFPKSEQNRLIQLVALEEQAWLKGYGSLAGVDEVGRGPLAGPVVAAACMIERGLFFEGINDSKQLTSSKRKFLFEKLIEQEGVQFGIGQVEHDEIDRINIYQATLLAMREAVSKLTKRPDCLLVDGMHLDMEGIYCEAIIKGDARSQMIAAASIIAKERRDQLMIKYHEEYPEYGFNEHKGYPTSKHRLALAKYGPCPIHRKTFRSVGLCRYDTLSGV